MARDKTEDWPEKAEDWQDKAEGCPRSAISLSPRAGPLAGNIAGVNAVIKIWLVSAAIASALALPGVANATVENLTISGSLDEGKNSYAYTGTLSLDVTSGQATSGTGTLSILGLTNAPLVLITTSSPGNEGTPVGYRANDGTDYFNLDQTYPIDANGLLFDVNTTTAKWGAYPLFTIWSNTPQSGYSAAFTGVVDGVEYYNLQGSAMVSNAGTFSSAVPEPSTWAMMLLGFAGLGYAAYRRGGKSRLDGAFA
jgi:hypothetical protein